MITLAVRLRVARAARGICQTELARLLRVGRKTVWSWEQGRTEPDASYVRLAAQHLGVSSAWLLEGPPWGMDRTPAPRA
jgi:transcriptional regulator with XRE-family HTH domain